MTAKIYVIHENEEWTEPLRKELEALGHPFETWHLDQGMIDLSKEPPQGIFYNRMSASSHTREHRYAPEFTGAVLDWLEAHGRIVLNTSRALKLEVSKVAQYTALESFEIETPKTMAAVGKKHIMDAAEAFGDAPFITKHNRAGKGLGVQLFENTDALKKYVEGPDFEEPIDGITLLQQYIQSPDSTITRCEFIGGRFFYAVEVDTSEGFELCPADACQIGDAFCPTTAEPKEKFKIIENFNDPIIHKYEAFLLANDIHFAGIEFIRDASGNLFTYDVNTNTNYNPDAERKAGKFGMKEIAKVLGELYVEHYR
ncbi:alpha-L-glutamate ligase [Alkalihalophilus pseudofirmus]|uniref:ATP-grasp domain-containing protein n=1 Tax=Alkalihalophilus pseudofirmus TaxID=79885 RepID=UPI00259B84DB|nr:alpha-L-glutamate ligase [Alkalihalophilus pseudofirmus]WEG16873.1 alpha-L-glutamate ligase [Alkalihalophilus pseudofirmus]